MQSESNKRQGRQQLAFFFFSSKDENEEDEVSFESSQQSMLEITSTGEVDLPIIAQKDLDSRVSLEDILIGEFDCFDA